MAGPPETVRGARKTKTEVAWKSNAESTSLPLETQGFAQHDVLPEPTPRKLGFRAWLVEQADRGDHIGDLARDTLAGPRRHPEVAWPRGRPTLRRLEGYLRTQGACHEALEALRASWEEWQDEFPPRRLRDLEPGITLDLSDDGGE